MSEILTTLHPDNDENTNLYPNIKKENIPAKAVNRTRLDDDVNSLLNSINELHPSGVDTEAHILAFTSNKGIYIGSDTGKWYYWNGTQYVEGGVYQAAQITPNTITNADLKDISINRLLETHINLFNSNDTDILANKVFYIYQGTVATNTLNGWSVSGWMKVLPNMIIYTNAPSIKTNGSSIIYFDEDKNPIGDYKVSANFDVIGSITIPDNCYYIRICFLSSWLDRIKLITNSDELIDIPYNKLVIDKLNIDVSEYDYIYKIKADGTGDFTNLRAAMESTNNSSKYLFEIYEGTYDVLSDYSQAEIELADYDPYNIRTHFCGIYVDGNITLKGIGDKNNIIIKGELSLSTYTSTLRDKISTLNLQGNITLENLTITSKYIRYPIHDDFKGSANKTTNIINCNLINYANNHNNGQNHAYGMGTNSGKITNLENCYLNPNFYEHTNHSFTKPSITTLKNSRCERSIDCSDMGSGVKDKVYIYGCNTPVIRYDWYNNNIQIVCLDIVCDNNIPYFNATECNIITGDVITIRNNTANTITKGSLIQRNGWIDYKLLDNDLLFLGVVLEDIAVGEYGKVQIKNEFNATLLGITAAVGDKFKIDNGSLVITSGNDYIAICDVAGYIRIL